MSRFLLLKGVSHNLVYYYKILTLVFICTTRYYELCYAAICFDRVYHLHATTFDVRTASMGNNLLTGERMIHSLAAITKHSL